MSPPDLPEISHLRHAPGADIILCPYVDGTVRPETTAVLTEYRHRVVFWPLNPADPYHYARLFAHVWNLGGNLVWIEHDMVPRLDQLDHLTTCPQPWCSHPYHVGEGRYTHGLGFCKFSRDVQRALPMIGYHAARDKRGGEYNMPWQGLNEAVTEQLLRRGQVLHLHGSSVTHLHYPEPSDAG